MPTPQLSFTKIVFPPTATMAVHTYTAGSFFAVISLNTADVNRDVHTVGKELFSNLEAEFFSLEDKTLPAIKNVIENAIKTIPESIVHSLAAAYIKENIAYLFVADSGTILLKRQDKLAAILDLENNGIHRLEVSSGFIQPNDLFFLETFDFAQHISPAKIKAVSDSLPNEMADAISGQLETAENSTAASIILKVEGFLTPASYATPTELKPVPADIEDKEKTKEDSNIAYLPQEKNYDEYPTNQPAHLSSLPGIFSAFKMLKPSRISLAFLPSFNLSIKTRIGLVAAVIVLIIIALSILDIKAQREQAKNQQIFYQYFDAAEKDYESGNGIIAVNPISTTAQSEFQKADLLLKQALQQLPAKSTQAAHVNMLLTQVESKLTQTENIQTVTVSDASAMDSPLLALEQKQGAKYVSSDQNSVYYINNTGIYKNNSSTALAANNGSWNQLAGFSVYYGNLYVLDKKNNIIKYVAGSGGYGKSSYLKSDVSPDFSKAVSMAIDSSVYVLTSDGNILKYSLGEPANFTLKGLTKPFSNPTRIFTTPALNSIYILDNGNSRIVQLGKDGTYEAEYAADALNKALDIDVQENNKKIFFLTSSGIKSIDLK